MRPSCSRPHLFLPLGLLASLALAAGLTASPESSGEKPVARHAREVERWRQDRLDRLQQPDGWLSLVGLAWLEEGENTCGGDPASAVPLPEKSPRRVGVFLRQGRDVTIVATMAMGRENTAAPITAAIG